MKHCIQCNAELTGKYQLKFCSSSCSASHSNSQTPRRAKTSTKWHDCPHCGTLTSNPKFCSRNCQKSNSLAKTLSPERKRQIQDRRNEANAKYRATKYAQTPQDIDRKAIQEFYANCPKGYEVDHIIPISKGGLHHINNLQYLTITENRRKSNKILE
jgi:5-methylcytosine-specific restriction endonuclease McrA